MIRGGVARTDALLHHTHRRLHRDLVIRGGVVTLVHAHERGRAPLIHVHLLWGDPQASERELLKLSNDIKNNESKQGQWIK